MRAYFGDGIPVRAKRIVKARRYSDVVVTRFDANGQAIAKQTVAADRPRASSIRWEPDTTPKVSA